jgi:hypothetical protein
VKRILILAAVATLAAACSSPPDHAVLIGPPGAAYATGAQERPAHLQGETDIVGHWTSYRVFSFENENVNVSAAEMNLASEIAAYLVRNPTFDVGIDGTMDAVKFSTEDRNTNTRRTEAVYAALLQAGVPAGKIRLGAMADPDRRQKGRIQVLIKTGT